jgi:hypothetical protein
MLGKVSRGDRVPEVTIGAVPLTYSGALINPTALHVVLKALPANDGLDHPDIQLSCSKPAAVKL